MENKKEIEKFWKFIIERDYLRRNKSLGLPRPWSKDDVLNTYRFCNIRREDDFCTKYLMKNIKELNFKDKIYNIILYRRFNTRDFFEHISPNSKPNELLGLLDVAVEKGTSIFNSAYTICQIPYNALQRKTDKHAQIAYSMADIASCEDLERPRELGEAKLIFEWLKFGGKHRIGDFLAYQMLVDISYIMSVKGMEDFVFVGPGAVGGLDMLYGKNRSRADDIYCIKLRNEQPNKPPFPLSLSNIQNCLCEYRKYVNLKTEPEKHRKRYYHQKNIARIRLNKRTQLGSGKWLNKNKVRSQNELF